ncbi:hypothetical protein GMOD_00002640 [Pyrenophora seminiperda CCB06]|uniref:Uncharacterized protein n=1 Tax=Pyrenophora seminiperda CCB06 TaxID=1302712 RepID=A0A3M7M2U5_9PLEO|nr:hypothetical protein GMOD_00002640 [Pyrenophora seminiperda CCB06]
MIWSDVLKALTFDSLMSSTCEKNVDRSAHVTKPVLTSINTAEHFLFFFIPVTLKINQVDGRFMSFLLKLE